MSHPENTPPEPTLNEQINAGLGVISMLSGEKGIRPLGWSQLLARARIVRKEEGENGRVYICGIQRSQMLTADGTNYFSMGVFFIYVKDVLEAWRKNHEMRLLEQVRHHYGHLGNCYVLSREVADELRPEVARLAERILI